MPALLIDRYWNVVRTNAAAPAFLGSIIDLEAFPKPRSLLDLTFSPAGLRPHIEDWERFAAGMLQRVRREAPGLIIDDRLQALLNKLRQYPGVDKLPVLTNSDSPTVPVTFRRGTERISYFSRVNAVGTPQTVTAQELRLECMFPFDPPAYLTSLSRASFSYGMEPATTRTLRHLKEGLQRGECKNARAQHRPFTCVSNRRSRHAPRDQP